MDRENLMKIYQYPYNYDDIKIAVCIQDWIDNHSSKAMSNDITFEDVAGLVIEIKEHWLKDLNDDNLTEEESAYIQAYAYRYLKEVWEENE